MTDSAGSLRDDLAGVAFTTPVPFDPGTNEVRYGALAENVAYLYDAGARLFVPCGNTGEYYALTDEERVGIVEAHVEAAGPESTVVAGAAGSVPEVQDLASAYADAGADAVMVMHPSHPYVHAEGLAEYYRRICEGIDPGILIYKRGPSIPRETLVAIGDREDVLGVKFAVGDVDEFAQSVAAAPQELTWLAGSAERYALSFAIEGAEGYTTGLGNFLPEATLALQEAIEAGDWERARSIRDLLAPIENLRDEPGGGAVESANNVPVVKRGLELAGQAGGPVRPPLVDLSAGDASRLEALYERVREAFPG